VDWKIDDRGNLVIEGGQIVWVKDQDAIAQKIRMRLMTLLEESVYDVRAGTPYLQVIFEPGTSLDAIRFILEQRVLGTPGVTDVTLTPVLDPEERVLTVTGTASTIRGDVTFSVTLSPGTGL